jgi:hypothetical protein
MITLEDCLAFCGFTEEEVLAIADGADKIRDMIVDDIRASQARGDCGHVLSLLHVLHHFLRSHPGCCPANHPWSSRF